MGPKLRLGKEYMGRKDIIKEDIQTDDDTSTNSDSEDDYTEEETDDSDPYKEGKVTIDNSTKYPKIPKGIENIEDLLSDSKIDEIEFKEKPDKNEPAFKNVNPKWGWKQEVMLLEGIQTNGLFQWELIAELLSRASGKYFKAEEVRSHYFQYYCNGTLGQVWNYQLKKRPIVYVDETDPVVRRYTKQYLPAVAPKNLKEIKFMPHREDFGECPINEIERMVTNVDFSSYYMDNLKVLKIDQEVRNLQLIIVNLYQNCVADRMIKYKLMRDFKLIEQFFSMDGKITKKCELEKLFVGLQKFVSFFDSPKDFIKFFCDCVREKLLKLEIYRLIQALESKKMKERDPEAKVLVKKRAPGCFSRLTKILYCTSLERERKNSNSQEEKELDEVLISAHQTLLEGVRLKPVQTENEDTVNL